MSVNRAILIGRLGKDPETFTTQAGKKIVSFSLATSERWRDANGERKERTTWHTIKVYNEGLANVASQWLKKGSQAYIEGAIVYREYEKDGIKRIAPEIALNQFGSTLVLLGDSKGADDGPRDEFGLKPVPQKSGTARQSLADELDDVVPFFRQWQ